MSRWSRRSDEEKQRIAEQQRELHARSRGIDLRKKDPGLEHDRQMNIMVEIYKGGDLPVVCRRHGVTGSRRYSIQKRAPPWGSPVTADRVLCIVGKCPTCGAEAVRFPQGEEVMLAGMLFDHLKGQGRLTDDR